MATIPLENLRKELMQDPEFVKEYNALELRYSLISALLTARTEAKMTQKEVAQRMGVSQPAVARMESGKSLSTSTIAKYAKATGQPIQITFLPV